MAAVIGTAVAGAVASGVINKALAPDVGPSPGVQQSNALTEEQAQRSREMGEVWRTNYKPVEEAMTSQALEAGSEAEQEAAANRFAADAATGYDQSAQALRLGLSRRGVNTTSPAYIQAMAGIQRDRAATTAGGMNRARVAERDSGFQKRATATGLGRNLASGEITGLGAGASRSLTAGSQDFYQQELLREQARQGLAGVAGPISDAAGSAVGDWLTNRNRPVAATSGPVNMPSGAGGNRAWSNY